MGRVEAQRQLPVGYVHVEDRISMERGRHDEPRHHTLAFGEPEWLAAAERAFAFISERMISDGRLLHAYRAGEARAPATADDYANMIGASLALANATAERDYIDRACEWADVLDRHYWSPDLGGYYFAADDTSDLIVRPFSGQDEATPNANGVMVSNLMALYLWTGEELGDHHGVFAATLPPHGAGLYRVTRIKDPGEYRI